jgi:hypothetical protein
LSLGAPRRGPHASSLAAPLPASGPRHESQRRWRGKVPRLGASRRTDEDDAARHDGEGHGLFLELRDDFHRERKRCSESRKWGFCTNFWILKSLTQHKQKASSSIFDTGRAARSRRAIPE